MANAPTTAADIAQVEGINPDATFRLLRACASLGLVNYDGVSRFAAAPLLDTLRKDNPKSLRALVLSLSAPGHWLPWGRFTDAVRTGQNQTISALGAGFFDYLAATSAEGSTFTQAMTSMTSVVAEELVQIIDVKSVRIVADIGGAGGTLLQVLLRAHPDLQGIVFDRPHVVAGMDAAARHVDPERRVTRMGGDFFDAVPAADLYLLKYILHDWDDEACIRILKNCRRALRPGGRIAVIEHLLGEIGEPGFASMLDLNMMILFASRERTLNEYASLFTSAGLAIVRVIRTRTPLFILEAVAA